MSGAKALAAAERARERLLRGDRAIPDYRRLEAGIAIAARRRCFAEIREQAHPPAGGRLAQAQQRIELGACHALELVLRVRCLDHAPMIDDVGESVRHPRIGRRAVTPRAPGLLVIPFDAFRQIEMRDETYVGLVD